jgi:Helicase conserved C-terminal domain
VVVFSERIPTLTWLAEAVPAALGFPRAAAPEKGRPWLAFGGVALLMHSEAANDEEQRRVVERFGLRDDPVRLLFTGDIASEGVNLHQQCHCLIHYDLPWSLIRIEQRNGRIDRYGQEHQPQFRALILTCDLPWRADPATGQPRTLDDRLVGEKLLHREEEAHKIEGSAEAVTGLFRAQDEENRLVQDLIAGPHRRTVDKGVAAERQFLPGRAARPSPRPPRAPRGAARQRARVVRLHRRLLRGGASADLPAKPRRPAVPAARRRRHHRLRAPA